MGTLDALLSGLAFAEISGGQRGCVCGLPFVSFRRKCLAFERVYTRTNGRRMNHIIEGNDEDQFTNGEVAEIAAANEILISAVGAP